MIENVDMSLVDWSRAQFALTAMYHWIFVPLTLGLSFIIAIMESIYVKTGKEEWAKITRFWTTLFGINFAIGVATGIIMEFEFGTNWSKYSWFVGDIFGAPLAIEGILAFFMESTFIAVMFFGWQRVSKKFHLISTWLVAIGSNLSALWILIANGWMQAPKGMAFNPETARNEMVDFWEVVLSPTAVHKFLHTITSSYTLGALFVVGVSAWFLLKKRHHAFAQKSIMVAAVFGLLASIYTAGSGDGSAKAVAEHQPMKLAAMEGLYEGEAGAPLLAFGVVGSEPNSRNPELKEVTAKIELPKLLSFLSFGDFDAFVPGVNDLIFGNEQYNIMSANEKIRRGKIARQKLFDYKEARKNGNTALATSIDAEFRDKDFQENYFKYFGYSFFNNVNDLIPNIPITFYSFHIMITLGSLFIGFFALILYLSIFKKGVHNKWLLRLSIFMVPLAYIASQAGWVVAEVGRQPWVIQDLMPTMAAVSNISVGAVQTTFWLFALIFTTLLIAELRIMFRQINNGPKS